MSHNGTLTGKQHAAIAALLTGCTNLDAAARVGISARTLQRWLTDDGFKTALCTAHLAMVDRAARMLASETLAAVETLAALHRDPAINPATRRAAASDLITHAAKLTEQTIIIERLDTIETNMALYRGGGLS